MSYDEGLAERIRELVAEVPDATEKKMFGGLCFMVSGNMCCGIVDDTLMARVGTEQYEECLVMPYAREMDFTGKPLRGMVYVDPEGIAEDADLKDWIGRCLNFTQSLPSK
jgi:TfoX/Sxy family transcriptional regulator of competence genes